MEKGSVRSLDSTICIKQYLIQQQLAKGHRHLLMLRQNIGGNEDFLFFFFLFFGHFLLDTIKCSCERFQICDRE